MQQPISHSSSASPVRGDWRMFWIARQRIARPGSKKQREERDGGPWRPFHGLAAVASWQTPCGLRPVRLRRRKENGEFHYSCRRAALRRRGGGKMAKRVVAMACIRGGRAWKAISSAEGGFNFQLKREPQGDCRFPPPKADPIEERAAKRFLRRRRTDSRLTPREYRPDRATGYYFSPRRQGGTRKVPL